MICVSLMESTISDVFASAVHCKSLGADIIEVRLDCIDEPYPSSLEKLSKLKEKTGLPIILTLRPAWEGGSYKGDEESRLAVLEEGIKNGFDYVDLELKMKDAERNRLMVLAKDNRVKVIISYHDFQATPSVPEITDLIKKCADAGGDLVKVVFTCNNCIDAFNILLAGKAGLLNQAHDYSIMGIGPYGHITRILAPFLGCNMVYASIDKEKVKIEGQVDLKTLLKFNNIDAETKVCGIIGKPLAHTLSPTMHNAAFDKLGLNYVYLAFEMDQNEVAFALNAMKELDFRGLNVTHPYKLRVIEYLDDIDVVAKEIGAVNTIVNNDGKLTGYNTDAFGAVEALRNHVLDLESSRKKILILGAGGAARAVAVPLAKMGNEMLIANRTYQRSEELAETLGKFRKAEAVQIDKIDEVITDVEILINCTPVGMKESLDQSPVSGQLIRSDMIVFDVIYNRDTPLLREAKKKGAKVIYGSEMFVYQGVKAFELWTGERAPMDVMREVIIQKLNELDMQLETQ